MDYTLHEWVRMASHHGSIARCAIEKQAEESGLDALAVREKMRHHPVSYTHLTLPTNSRV